MNKFIALTKVLLKTNGTFLSKGKKVKVNNKKNILLMILIAFSFLPLTITFGRFIYNSTEVLQKIGQEVVVISLGFTIASMIIFVFGIFYVMGTFYFSMDIQNLLPLPLRPSQILGGKFTVVVLYEYLTELVVLLPIIIAYGIKVDAGLMYYIYSIIVFLTLPIVPLVIGSIIVMIIMRFTDFAKNKDRFKVVAGILGIFFAVGINIIIQKGIGNTLNPEQLEKLLLEGNNSLINVTSKILPSLKFASLGLVNSNFLDGLVNILLFIIINIGALLIFTFVGEALYLKGVVGISETTSKRKKLGSKEFSKATQKNSEIKTYTLKEIKHLLRTPAYFMNCILVNFLWPVFMLIPFFAQSNKSDMSNLINKLSNTLNDYSDIGGVVAIVFGVIIFSSASNAITATSISREGHNFYVNKYLPISFDKQITAKVLTGFIMSAISMVLLLSIFSFIVKPPIITIVILFIVSVIGIVFSSIIGMFIDLNNPKLVWDNEQKAVKQNLNVMISMLLGMVSAGLTIFIVFKFKLNTWETLSLIVVLFGAIDLLLWKLLMSKGANIYSKIEA